LLNIIGFGLIDNDILVLRRIDNKYFGYLWDINKVFITTFRAFIVMDDEKSKDRVMNKINAIKERHKRINDFEIFSINSEKCPEEIFNLLEKELHETSNVQNNKNL